MHRIHVPTRILGLAALLAVALPHTASAQVTIAPTVSFNNGLYTYNYSVTNNTTDTLALTTFEVRPVADAVTLDPATFPAGFFLSFDPGLGLVSFLEDADPNTPQEFAAGTTVSGFTFTSAYQPMPSHFEALDINGNLFMGTTLAPTDVPEPGSVAIGLTFATGMASILIHRRRDCKRTRS